MNRNNLIDLVRVIMNADGTEGEIEQKIYQLKKNIVDPKVTNYIFYDDLTPEQVVDKALQYKPIQL